MAGKGSDYAIKKTEESAVQKFKNQNKLLKKFGKKGLKVYKAVTKKGLSGSALAEKVKLPSEELSEIVSFMEKSGMAEISGEAAPPPKEEKPAPKKEEKPAPPEKPKEAAPPRAPPAPPKPPKPPKAARREEEIRPISEEEMEEFREAAPLEEKEEKPEEKAPPEEKEEEIKPLEFEEKEAKKPAPPPRAPPAPPRPPAARPPPRPPAAPPPREEEEAPEEEYLTPSEKAIKDKYGEKGLKVYSFIDGKRTAEQIMRDTGVTEAQLIEMLDFMEKKGIIRLEHPGRRRAPPPPPRAPPPRMMPPPAAGPAPRARGRGKAAAPPSAAAKSMFAPMVEEKPELAAPITKKELLTISLDVPVKTTKNVLGEIQAKARVMLKLGKEYVKAYEMMDGKRDVVEICIALKLPLYKLYDLLNLLQEMNVLMLKPEAREDVRKKYGEDGYSVYKKYGREGVLLYQLIGKEMSLKEMASLITTSPEKIIEMFMFIHKLLGIELPIDEDVLRERLGIQKKPPAA